MKFAFGLLPQAIHAVAQNAVIADAEGFDILYTGDMQATHRELHVTLTVMGSKTSRARIGSGVTNPVTRHPVVTASAFATLSELTGGRAFMGIGCGDSAMRNSGLRPAKLKDLEEFILTVKALYAEGRATYQGTPVKLAWWENKYPVPILMSAHGPKSLEMAGRIADGAIVGLGLTDSAVEQAFFHLDKGARAAGRSVKDLEVWFVAHSNIADDSQSAVREIATTLAVSGNLLGHGDMETVPAKYLPAVKEFAGAYDYNQHAASTHSTNAALMEKLGLLDYFTERFGIAGTVDECRSKVSHLKRLGVENIWCSRVPPECSAFLHAWSKGVIARV